MDWNGSWDDGIRLLEGEDCASQNTSGIFGKQPHVENVRRPKRGRPAGDVTCHGCGKTWEVNCWRRRGQFHDCAALPQAA